jgi:hypothetical protein
VHYVVRVPHHRGAYLVHRHPSWSQPLVAVFSAVTVMGTLVGAILAR